MRSKLLLPRYPNSKDADADDFNEDDSKNDDNNDQRGLRRRIRVGNKKFDRRRRNFRTWSLCWRSAAHNFHEFLCRNFADVRQQILKQTREIYYKLDRKMKSSVLNIKLRINQVS